MTTTTKKTVKKAASPKTAATKKKTATKTAASKAPVKKASKPKAAPAKADKPAPKAEKTRLRQVLPGGTVEAEVVTKKGNKVIKRESIKLTQKSAMTLAALQAAKGEPLPKAALFQAIVKAFKIETSQDGFRVNEQCHLLEAAGLAVMSRIEGGGAAQYRSATERGMSVVLPEISRIG